MNCPQCGIELDIKVLEVVPVQKPLGPIPKMATAATRAWLISQINANPGESGRIVLLDFCRAMGMISKQEQLETLPLKYVPTSISQLKQFQANLDEFANGLQGKVPVVNDPVSMKIDTKPKVTGWRTQVIHLTRMAGRTLGTLTPEEIASWHTEFIPVDSWTDADGVVHQKRPESIAKDRALRLALDQAMAELKPLEELI